MMRMAISWCSSRENVKFGNAPINWSVENFRPPKSVRCLPGSNSTSNDRFFNLRRGSGASFLPRNWSSRYLPVLGSMIQPETTTSTGSSSSDASSSSQSQHTVTSRNRSSSSNRLARPVRTRGLLSAMPTRIAGSGFDSRLAMACRAAGYSPKSIGSGADRHSREEYLQPTRTGDLEIRAAPAALG